MAASKAGWQVSPKNKLKEKAHMPNVHNWQLGREMSYPYEGAYPERQWAFVFNINR